VGATTHRIDVRQVRGRRAMADVIGRGPVAAEVPALDEEIRRHHDVSVADAEHGRVVARPDQHLLALGEHLSEPLDQRELTDVRHRRVTWQVGGERHAHIPPDPVAVRRAAADRPVRPDVPRGRFCPAVERHAPTDSEETSMVVQAYILIQTDVGKAAEVARAIAQVKGVTLAEDVTGPYDVIVRAEARNVDELGKLVVSKVQNLDGITRTLTCPVVHI
jgi:DNA-binding Lrp family transcriptional regulator